MISTVNGEIGGIRKKGIKLSVILVIMAILVMIAVPACRNLSESEARANLALIAQCEEKYFLTHGKYIPCLENPVRAGYDDNSIPWKDQQGLADNGFVDIGFKPAGAKVRYRYEVLVKKRGESWRATAKNYRVIFSLERGGVIERNPQ